MSETTKDAVPEAPPTTGPPAAPSAPPASHASKAPPPAAKPPAARTKQPAATAPATPGQEGTGEQKPEPEPAKPDPEPAKPAMRRPPAPPSPASGAAPPRPDPTRAASALDVEVFEPELRVGRGVPGERVIIFGPGSVGKSTISALAAPRDELLFVDLEDGSGYLDVRRVESRNVPTWERLRGVLRSKAALSSAVVVIDNATRAEELCIEWVCRNIKHEKGYKVSSIEGYGFGKGWRHLYETFGLLLADLDQLVRRGKDVVLIAHEITETVKNPDGDDYLRWEPRLSNPPKSNLRSRVFEWADHVLYLGFDVAVQDGKGVGGGTRTIWPVPTASHHAKSRSLDRPMPFRDQWDDSIWLAMRGLEPEPPTDAEPDAQQEAKSQPDNAQVSGAQSDS